jgi:hypothetical protein
VRGRLRVGRVSQSRRQHIAYTIAIGLHVARQVRMASERIATPSLVRRSWILGALLVGAVGCSSSGGGNELATKDTSQSAAIISAATDRSAALAVHDQWRRLWEDHITWTRMVIVGIFHDVPGTSTYTERLLQNYEDMEDALSPYYGEEEAEEFGDLLKDHLTIAASILIAAKAGDTAQVNVLVTEWRANADALATKMNELNPRYWPLAEAKAMWQEHLDVTLEEATDNLTGNYDGELAAWEKVHDGALMMADFVSNGLLRQFPGRFAASGTIR